MILGIQLQSAYLIAGGLGVAALIALEMLIGLRVIKFKGRTHLKVHKTIAWIIAAVAVSHGTVALTYFNNWKILS